MKKSPELYTHTHTNKQIVLAGLIFSLFNFCAWATDCPTNNYEYTSSEWTPVKDNVKSYVLQSKKNEYICCEVGYTTQEGPNAKPVWWRWHAPLYKLSSAKKVTCPDKPKPKPKQPEFCKKGCDGVCFEKYQGPKDTESYRIYFKYDSVEPNKDCNKQEWLENIKSIYTDNAPKEIDRIIIVGGSGCEGSPVVNQRVKFVHDTLQSVAPAGEINKLTDCEDGSPNPDCSMYVNGSSRQSALGYQFNPETEGCKYRVVYVHVTFKRYALKQLINSMINTRDVMADNASVWKTAQGNFNGARLASDSIAGVVLGTAGGLITSSVLKKHQVESGMENVMCTIGGQSVATYGDEFTVGIQ